MFSRTLDTGTMGDKIAMVLNEDYSALLPQLETILAELDRLQLPLVAVHVDMALARLTEIIEGSSVVSAELRADKG